jgi:POT family proton-dependent oligopeptide transporter
MSTKYATTPDQTRSGMPPGVPFIIGNEAAERFSFYGMRAILTIFLSQYLIKASGVSDTMNDEEAKGVFHMFVAAAYFTPLLGAMISDIFWGKYKTILLISLMYCVGHGCLALMDLGPILHEQGMGGWDMKPFLYAGLVLIAIGAGGIKPCVSANVGDQFGRGNKHLMTQIFNWFYFSINAGAVASQLLTPYLLANYGPWLAFGTPGVLMGIATFIFWMGRHKFVHVPPAGWERFKNETFSKDGLRALLNLSPLFLLFVPMFWAIFDQTGSAWVLQADRMDRDFLGISWLPSQIQAVNPFLILIGIPFFTYFVYPMMGKVFEPRPLRKIGIGLFMTAVAFGLSAWIETGIQANAESAAAAIWAATGLDGAVPMLVEAIKSARTTGIDEGVLAAFVQGQPEVANLAPDKIVEAFIQSNLTEMPNVGWQFLAYIVLTAAEIMVSIVCLEFAYTQAPPKMKSFIMGVYFLGVSLGNVFVSLVNWVLEGLKDESGASPLDGAAYYWFFTGLMAAISVVYVVWSQFYKGRVYIQGDTDEKIIEAEAEAEGTETR